MADRVVLVTGAEKDLGLAIVKSLSAAGYTKIAIATKSQETQDHINNALTSDSAIPDVSVHTYSAETYEDIDAMVGQAVSTLGSFHSAINCISLPDIVPRPTAETSVEDLRKGLSSSSREIWMQCKAQTTHFTSTAPSPPSASIVNIIPYGNLGVTSTCAIQAMGSYGCIGITKTLARDAKPHNIRVNAVSHGVLAGDKSTSAKAYGEEPQATVEDVAAAAVFLISPAATSITGVNLPVDGGWNLTHS